MFVGIDSNLAHHNGIDRIKASERMPESASEYQDVFGMARERIGLSDPQRWLNAIIFRRFASVIRREAVSYDEVLHEAVVGMYLGLQELGSARGEEDWKTVANKVNSHLTMYLYPSAKVNSEITFSEFFGTDESGSAESLMPIISSEDKMDSDPVEQAVRNIETQELLDQAREIIISSESRSGQGEKDWEVFVRHVSGQTAEEIALCCDWLKNIDSAEKAIVRILKRLRGCFDGDISAPIITGSKNHHGSSGRNEDRSRYYQQWYERNAERRRAKMRDYMREKRIREKILRIEEDNDENE